MRFLRLSSALATAALALTLAACSDAPDHDAPPTNDASPSHDASPASDAHASDAPTRDAHAPDAPAPATCSQQVPSPEPAILSPDPGGPVAAQMNDVSILFPLPSHYSDVDQLLPACATGPRGALLPASLYASVGPIHGSTFPDAGPDLAGPGIAEYANLHVVAMRVDPCFASLAPAPDGSGCTAQIRLVFQEIYDDNNGFSFENPTFGTGPAGFDGALHVLYTLTRDELLALTRSLVALREANQGDGGAGGPLAPHPIIAAQGLTGAMGQGVERLILQYAGASNISRVALLDFSEAFIGWSFDAFSVSSAADGSVTPLAIPTLPDAGFPDDAGIFQGVTTGFTEEADAGTFFVPTFSPATTIDGGYATLSPPGSNTVTPATAEAAFEGLVRIENPNDHSPNTIDCGSCHLATPTEKEFLFPALSLDDETSPLSFQPDGVHVTRADMAVHYSQPEVSFGNLHAFSYLARAPSINQRTVNETARVVEYLNALPE